MVIIVGVEELAGHGRHTRNICAVEIQHDVLGWSLVLLDEVIPKSFMGFHYGLLAHSLFHPAQS